MAKQTNARQKQSEVELFLWPRLRQLRHLYQTNPSTETTYNSGSKLLHIAKSLSGARSSQQIASLESFLAEVLLAGGSNAATVRAAKTHAESALRRLDATSRVSAETLSLTIHVSLIDAVASKAMGDIDESFRILEATIADTKSTLSATPIDQVPLVRQQAIMLQRREVFAHLVEDAPIYAYERPTEYFATLKRFFEYLLNHGHMSLAREVERPLRNAYLNARQRLPIVARVSFVKNFGHYLILSGQQRLGRAVLTEAMMAATEFSFVGQQRQIVTLLQGQPGGVRLPSFRVDAK